MPHRSSSLTRRVLLAGAGAIAASRIHAEESRGAITLVVPFAPGGPTDIVARLAAEGMARRLGRAIVVENLAGAGGATGSLRAARARADGSTMVLAQMATHALTPLLNPQAGYDPVADFEPIGLIASAPMVLAARRGLPAATLREFQEFVRANDRRLSFGHAGIGATSQVACVLFNMAAMAMPASVAYRGTAPALNDLAGGQIDFVCDQLTSVAPLIRAGQVQGVALMAKERSETLPELATASEQGFPELAVDVWNGLAFPKGVSRETVEAANAALVAALRDPQLRSRFVELGATVPEAEANTPDAFGALVKTENERWGPVLRQFR